MKTFLARRLDPNQRYGLRVTLFAAAVAVVAVPFAWLVVQITGRGRVVKFDTGVAHELFGLKMQYPWLSTFFNAISFLGFPPWLWLLIGAASIFLWRKDRKRLVAYLLTTSLLGTSINSIVKLFVDRPRPTFRDPSAITFQRGQSFPSGHVMSSTVIYGAMLLIFLPMVPLRWRKPAVGGFFVLVTAMAIARLGLGVHFVSDVVAGFLLGIAWLAASTAAFSLWRVESGRPPVEPMEGLEPENPQDLKEAL